MMSVKDKMYNYEVAPPPESWQTIAAALDKPDFGKVQLLKKRNNAFYLSLAAAAIIIMFFSIIIRFTYPDKDQNRTITGQSTNKDQRTAADKITIPQTGNDDDNLAIQNTVANNKDSDPVTKYCTISGPQGQPVKISSKVASLIISSDNQDPPNPVWNDKVKKWKNIMKANILTPTTANFLDIVDLTYALNDQ